MDELQFYMAIINKKEKEIMKFLSKDFPIAIKALAFAMLGQFFNASRLILEYDLAKPGQRNQYILEANLLIARKNRDINTLLSTIKDLRQYYSESFIGNYVLYELFRKQKQWDYSYECISKCLNLLPNNDNLHIEAASLQIKLKNSAKAANHLRLVNDSIKKIIPCLELTILSRGLYCVFFLTMLFIINNPIVLYITFLVFLFFWIFFQSRDAILPRDLSARSLLCFFIYYLLYTIYVNILKIW